MYLCDVYIMTYHKNQHELIPMRKNRCKQSRHLTSDVDTGGSMLFNFFTATFIAAKKTWYAVTNNNPTLFLQTFRTESNETRL